MSGEVKRDNLPRRNDDGLYSIMLRPCTAEVLRDLLDPEVPFVWVVGHAPNRCLEWWTCRLPLGRSDEPRPLEIRGLYFDVHLPTGEFLERLAEFDGLVLHQMQRRVPNSLVLHDLPDRDRTRILVQNGLVASFYLPHAMECASFATVEHSRMEMVLGRDRIRDLAY